MMNSIRMHSQICRHKRRWVQGCASLGVDLGVLLVASLPEQSRTFVASAAVSRDFVQLSEFTLVGRGGTYRGFWRVITQRLLR